MLRNRSPNLFARVAALLCAIGGACPGIAAESEDPLAPLAFWGVPKVDTYYPRETGARGDLHSIGVLPNGELAVSTSLGLLTFDGTHWEQLPDLEWPTSTLALGDGRAIVSYAAGLAEIKPDGNGGYATRVLTPPEQYTDHIHALKQAAVARGHTFGLDGNKLIEVDPQGAVTRHELPNWSNGIFAIGDELFAIGGLQTLLNRWDWERRAFVDHSYVLEGTVYLWMTGWAPRLGGGAWLLTETEKIIEFDGQRCRLWPGNKVIEERRIKVKCFVETAPGTLAIGTSSQGVIAIDGEGAILSRYSKEHGLDDVTVLQIGLDAQQGLWIATKNSLTRIARQSQTLVFDERHGLPESVLSLAFFDGRIFLGAPEGLYASRRSPSSMDGVFELIIPQDDVTDLLVYEDHLFIAGTKALAMNREGEIYPLEGQEGSPGFWQPSRYPNALLAVDLRGIRRYERIDGRWGNPVRLAGPNVNIYSIIEDAKGALFATVGDNRVAVVTLDERGGSYELVSLPKFTVGMWSYLVNIDGEAYVNGHPCLRWDASKAAFVEEPLMHYYPGAPPYGFQRVFGTSAETAQVAVNGRRGATVPRPSPQVIGDISSLGNSIETRADCVGYDAHGNLWAGGPFGLVRSSQPKQLTGAPSIAPRIHRLTSTTDGKTHRVAATKAEPLALDPAQKSLRIEMEFPNFDRAQHHQYQIFVEGNDSGWPLFSSSAVREITNLPPGSYTIRMAARDAAGQTFEGEPIHLALAAPWYQRPWAYALYVSAVVAIVAAIVLFYNRVQIRRSRTLQRLVRERTREIEASRRELEQQAITLEQQNRELEEKSGALQTTTKSLAASLAQLQEMQDQLVATARTAGKAEIATNVLHNVGNVLNSINISRSVLARKAAHSKVANLTRLARLVESHLSDIDDFLTKDPKGKAVPQYLLEVARVLQEESASTSSELDVMEKDIEHVKRIVAAQQSHAKSHNLPQDFNLRDLTETALTILGKGEDRPKLQILNEIPKDIVLHNDKHRLLEILLNLISNGLDAIRSRNPARGSLRLEAQLAPDGETVELRVADNGVGIDPATQQKLFTHGFTTKVDGHGFGLHSSAIAARNLGGKLSISSPGPGRGATATVTLPRRYQAEATEPSAPASRAEPTEADQAATAGSARRR